jgi:hypothetical protein
MTTPFFLPGSRFLLIVLLALALPLAVGCDSNDDGGSSDGLGDLSVRATTPSDASALGVTVTYYRDTINSASQTISFSGGSGTLDLEDDVQGVQVTGNQTGQSFTYTLELISDGEVIDSASGDFSTTVRVEAGDTEIPGF